MKVTFLKYKKWVMCYKNVLKMPKSKTPTPPKWGTCHNGKYVIISYPNILKSKTTPNQNGDTLWAICVCVITRVGWDPIGVLLSH